MNMTSSSRNPTEQTGGGVSLGCNKAVLLCGEESKLTHHNTELLMVLFHSQPAFQTLLVKQGFHCWDNRKESLGQPLQAGVSETAQEKTPGEKCRQ